MTDSTTNRTETDIVSADEVAEFKRHATTRLLAAQPGVCAPAWPRDMSAKFFEFACSLADNHEALRAERDVAYDVIRRLRDGWEPDMPCIGPEVWCWFRGDEDPEPMTDAERAVLDAVAGSNDPPALDLGGSARCVECDSPHRFGERCAPEGADG